MARQILDDPFYYLVNFQTVLAWLGERYGDVLSDDERAFIDALKRSNFLTSAAVTDLRAFDMASSKWSLLMVRQRSASAEVEASRAWQRDAMRESAVWEDLSTAR